MFRLAIVIPWYGADLNGGAERLAWESSHRIADAGVQVEVLTTCSRAFLSDWSDNYYPPGVSAEGNVTVRRFPVIGRRHVDFDRINGELLSGDRSRLLPGVSPLTPEKEDIFVFENINSNALLKHLETSKDSYDAVLFLPYLYGPIMQGVSIVKEKAILQPCLHDEPYAYLTKIANCFYDAKQILFNSDGEMELATRLYGPGILGKSSVVGTGVEFPKELDPLIASSPLGDSRYLLCMGRRDVGKNTHVLVEAFEAYIADSGSDLELVIAGPGDLPRAPTSPQVIDRGVISEQEKWELLAHCRALVNISTNESFSRVMFEAWFTERPVVVHADCLATATALHRAGDAGWAIANPRELFEAFQEIDTLPSKRISEMGRKGGEYARSIALWEGVVDRYLDQLELITSEQRGPVLSDSIGFTVQQVTPGLAYGDAISGHVMFLRTLMQSLGWNSEIFVQYLDNRLWRLANIYTSESIDPSDVLLYHHSVGWEYTDRVIQHPGPKVMVYHNITPSQYFEGIDPTLERLMRVGRGDLPRLAKSIDLALAVSDYNAEELRNAGFSHVQTLPIPVNPAKWAYPADPETLTRLNNDGRINLLFVGRVSPQKCQHNLVELLEHVKHLVPEARLVLVGEGDPGNPYVQKVMQSIQARGLENDVLVTGKVDDAQLHAYFRCADLYVSMSEHEGMGLPLIEAMWFDIPVLAYATAAVPETLGDSGVLFGDKTQLIEVANMAAALIKDTEYRNFVIEEQRENRLRFAWNQLQPLYLDVIERQIGDLAKRTQAHSTLSVTTYPLSNVADISLTQPLRILVIKLDHLGDFLLAVPAMEQLRRRFQPAQMDLICGNWAKPLARQLGYFDEVYTYNFFAQASATGPKRVISDEVALIEQLDGYDIAIDLRRQADTRFMLSAVPARLRVGYESFSGADRVVDVCLDSIPDEPGTATALNHTSIARQLLDLVDAIPLDMVTWPDGNGPREKMQSVALFPGAGNGIKQWPIERFVELAKRFMERHQEIAVEVYTSSGEEELAERFKALGGVKVNVGLPVEALTASVGKHRVVVANNSFGAHLGSFLGSYVVAIYGGHELAEEWRPVFGRCTVLTGKVACSPCHLPSPEQCTEGLACLRSVMVDDVLRVILQHLQEPVPNTAGQRMVYLPNRLPPA